jgi:deazaflavin-dependent oxidoreductase (nitroreductase family)
MAPDWSAHADEEYCYLTTVGRVTGRDHTIEIWFVVVDGRVYLLSGGRDRADWVRNLMAEPRVRLRVAGDDYPATAAVAVDDETSRRARRLLVDKYQDGYDNDLTSWRDTALPVVVTPRSGPG